MTAQISIRKAELKDVGTIARFNAAMAEETEHIQLDMDRLQQGVEGLLNAPMYGVYILAEVNGTTVGQTMITYEWSDWRNGLFWWIQSVYVLPNYRTQGVFRALYNFTLDLAQRQKNVCGLRLYVDKENERAYHIYRKLGMKETAYKMLEVDFVLHR
ncbi:MAG: GNAT family N-acetyltransferase [Bacteroidota bacterium]|nr:GNAT family N-acetyltransferase [Bacteroidota bacterium]